MSAKYQAIKTADGETIEQHPSYAVVQISRASGTSRVLFDSSIKHGETITLSICRAERQRGLHQHWIHAKQELIEVEMSTEQFAQMVTHLNQGAGTPCTLRRLNWERIPDPPYNNPNTLFREEFKKDAARVGGELDEVIDDLQALIVDRKATMTSMREILGKMKMVRQAIMSNMPFVASQFDRHMEHTMTEAKAAVEAFATAMVIKSGLAAMDTHKVAELPEVTKDKEITQ
jgi:hypothetical protein